LAKEVFFVGINVVEMEADQFIKTWDCDDYARRLQEKALEDGYIMSFELIGYAEYNTLFKRERLQNGVSHAINSVIIANEVYYIEPQNHEIVLVAYIE